MAPMSSSPRSTDILSSFSPGMATRHPMYYFDDGNTVLLVRTRRLASTTFHS